MLRGQLEHAIRTACQIIDSDAVIIVGSQAILGTFDEDELPLAATMSLKVDVLPIADTAEETTSLANEIEGVAGELSPFETLHGFSIDGVDLTTSILPTGWRSRLVCVQGENTTVADSRRLIGWCLQKEDLCVAKLCAFRDKDLNFVGALLSAGLVDPEVILVRLSTVGTEHQQVSSRATTWMVAHVDGRGPDVIP